MKNSNPVRLILLIVTLIIMLPFAVWILKEKKDVSIYIPEKDLEYINKNILIWPFLNQKAIISRENNPSGEGSFFILSDSISSRSEDTEAELSADQLKESVLNYSDLISDVNPLSDASHSLFRDRLEEFFHVKRTGWAVTYSRKTTPLLEFVHEDGRKIILKGDHDFDGTPPEVSYKSRAALIYQRIFQYIPEEPSTGLSYADFHLTAAGEKALEKTGVSGDFPLLIEQKSPLIHSGFIPLDLSMASFNPGIFNVAGKIWYRSRISLFKTGSRENFYWRIAVPWIRDLIDQAEAGTSSLPESDHTGHRFFIRDDNFYRTGDGGNAPFFIKGVNLGTALPGKWFTQFPQDELLYFSWFSGMKAMNFNTLRVYTLLPPSFYRALRMYNIKNSADPLYLLQEIWPEEHPPENNYMNGEYSDAYWNEIRMDIDALHGNVEIPVRTGRAWGQYTNDVSPWVLAYLIGREMEPDEVIETNRLNPEAVYNGRFISAADGPATEAWLAESCDRAVGYEISQYGNSRPVGIVSWPTLDTMVHPLEWNDPDLNGRAPYNDKAQVDIRNLTVEDSSFGGLFGAYHIYPNYPDFMNNETSFASYKDEQGHFRYGGYLEEFIKTQSGYPAIVAEYGLSTSKATAHFNPDGYDHGGLSEDEQARGIIRMTEAIRHTGYAGAVIFEWMDEWAKKTWTTEPFMIPYNRQALWHNALDPEQNYGIMAMTGVSHLGEKTFVSDRTGNSLTLWGDEASLYIRVTSPDIWSRNSKIYIGLDTNSLTEGVGVLPSSPPVVSDRGLESLVEVDMNSGEARLLNGAEYNFSTLKLSGKASGSGGFEKVSVLVNRAYTDESGKIHEAQYAEWGILESGPLDEPLHSILTEKTSVTVRLPWGLINVSDPSQGKLLFDDRVFYAPPAADVIGTVKTEGISVAVVIQNSDESQEILPDITPGQIGFLRYDWTPWDLPRYEMKEKKSVQPIREYLGSF